MQMTRPVVVLIAGPNGAGKSTSAPRILQGALHVQEFVNADAIARGLSVLHPDRVGIAAGRVMLMRLRSLAAAHRSFAFETTLASRTFAPWMLRLREEGYRTHLIYLALATPELAIARVAGRVRAGGHDVPVPVIRRRYQAGVRNLLGSYAAAVDDWEVIDNSELESPVRVASGGHGRAQVVHDLARWSSLVAWVR